MSPHVKTAEGLAGAQSVKYYLNGLEHPNRNEGRSEKGQKQTQSASNTHTPTFYKRLVWRPGHYSLYVIKLLNFNQTFIIREVSFVLLVFEV